MALSEAVLPHVPVFCVVLARMTGLFVFAPLLSSAAVPRRIKALLAVALALAVYPTIDHAAAAALPLDLYVLGPLMASELLIGVTIGLVAALPMMSVQLGGLIMGQQMGIGLAGIYNPVMEIDGEQIGQLLFYVMLLSFLAVGGLELMYGAVVHTFAAVPPGGFSVTRAPLDLLVGVIASGFVLALRMAMPLLAIIFLENIAIGFLGRTLPQLNIMSMGFPLRILIGMFVVTASVTAFGHAMGGELERAIGVIERWALSP
ncbi:MAG: flagellar biosynthetic protein FliR [Phycisphaerales bacterium]|nr:flagellar biosynthetic protein FliR [Phycisphaerales bacterium]